MTSCRTRKLALATALAVTALPAFALAGAGEVIEVESEIKIRKAFPAFHGKVVADNDNCVMDRRAKLFKERRNGGKKLLGYDRTDAKGKWAVEVDPLKSGVYYAVVKRYENATAGPIYDCLRAKSRTLSVD